MEGTLAHPAQYAHLRALARLGVGAPPSDPAGRAALLASLNAVHAQMCAGPCNPVYGELRGDVPVATVLPWAPVDSRLFVLLALKPEAAEPRVELPLFQARWGAAGGVPAQKNTAVKGKDTDNAVYM